MSTLFIYFHSFRQQSLVSDKYQVNLTATDSKGRRDVAEDKERCNIVEDKERYNMFYKSVVTCYHVILFSVHVFCIFHYITYLKLLLLQRLQGQTCLWHLNGFPGGSNHGSTVSYRVEAHRYNVHLLHWTQFRATKQNKTKDNVVVVVVVVVLH